MSREKKVEKQIDFLKTIVIALLVGLFGMASYLVVNVNTIVPIQAIFTTVGIIIDIIALAFLARMVIIKMNELEEL